MGPKLFAACGVAILLALAAPGATAIAAGASNNHTVLILETTVAGGMASPCAQYALGMGYTVELVSPEGWMTKTTTDFATYRAIILGDPHTEAARGSRAPIAAAEATVGVWGPAIDGNVFIIGSDPANHLQWIPNSDAVLKAGIGYVLTSPQAEEKTGFYFSTSWYYNTSGTNNIVNVLSYFGRFVVNENTYCWDDIHITEPMHQTMSGLTDAALSNWNCTIHALFVEWPANFKPLAIADAHSTIYTAPDGSMGTPFIFYRDNSNCGVIPSIVINGATPDTLWAPNHKMIDIVVDAMVFGSLTNVTRTITSSETPNAPWTVYYEDGVDLFHFALRADRNASKIGRTYTITYTGTDLCGNQASVSVIVVVPHDQGKIK